MKTMIQAGFLLASFFVLPLQIQADESRRDPDEPPAYVKEERPRFDFGERFRAIKGRARGPIKAEILAELGTWEATVANKRYLNLLTFRHVYLYDAHVAAMIHSYFLPQTFNYLPGVVPSHEVLETLNYAGHAAFEGLKILHRVPYVAWRSFKEGPSAIWDAIRSEESKTTALAMGYYVTRFFKSIGLFNPLAATVLGVQILRAMSHADPMDVVLKSMLRYYQKVGDRSGKLECVQALVFKNQEYLINQYP